MIMWVPPPFFITGPVNAFCEKEYKLLVFYWWYIDIVLQWGVQRYNFPVGLCWNKKWQIQSDHLHLLHRAHAQKLQVSTVSCQSPPCSWKANIRELQFPIHTMRMSKADFCSSVTKRFQPPAHEHILWLRLWGFGKVYSANTELKPCWTSALTFSELITTTYEEYLLFWSQMVWRKIQSDYTGFTAQVDTYIHKLL